MRASLVNIALPQLDELIERSLRLLPNVLRVEKTSNVKEITADVTELVISGTAAIIRLSGSEHNIYIEQVSKINEPYYSNRINKLLGILRALRNDIAAGYLTSVEELIHADLFSDFLEMAQHLLEEGYKDPAAVMIGGVLEEHLRKLCIKNGIAVEITDNKGVARPKQANNLNQELTAANVYSKLDSKSVASWQELRNNAAHGDYQKYKIEQVNLMLQGVMDFIVRNPA